MKYITLAAVFLGLHVFVDCQKGVKCRVPKLTFTSVIDLPKNSVYLEKYIKVAWCLYPHVPEKIQKLYVQISKKYNDDRRYFEILNHTTCRCRQFKSKTTAGYKELRKANIPEIYKTKNVNMAGIRCNDGPHVYRQWLGRHLIHPWIKVHRCISYKCKPAAEKTITKVKYRKDTGNNTYTVSQHVNCTTE